MKRTPLLNRHLSALISQLGHKDEIVVADAGLPIPRGVEIIDLALTPGLPTLFDVITALRHELIIEAAIWAKDANNALDEKFAATIKSWGTEQEKSIRNETITHDALKERCNTAKAVIRTGDNTAYCNIILVSGVAF